MDRDLKETKSDKADKFRELQQRDKEMTQFIDSFDETKQKQMESNTATELTIIALLERILYLFSSFLPPSLLFYFYLFDV